MRILGKKRFNLFFGHEISLKFHLDHFPFHQDPQTEGEVGEQLWVTIVFVKITVNFWRCLHVQKVTNISTMKFWNKSSLLRIKSSLGLTLV